MEKELTKQRILYPDLLRIVAVFFVIVIHEVGSAWRNMDPETLNWDVINIYDAIARFCVPVFIMISGSFMLDSKREYSLKKLYTHNILRIVTAFIFWSGAYAVIIKFLKYRTINKDVIIEMAFAFIKGHYHLWFMFTIVFLYMITPLLRKICENRKAEEYFLILSALPLLYNFVTLFTDSETLKAVYDNTNVYFVMGYTVYFVLGHYLSKYDTPKKIRVMVYIAGIIAVIASAAIARSKVIAGMDRDANDTVYSYLLPTTLLSAAAVFLFFKYGVSKIKFGARASKAITTLSKLSFGIYLSHVFVISFFTAIGIKIYNYSAIWYVPVMSCADYIFSAVVMYIISKIPVLKKYII